MVFTFKILRLTSNEQYSDQKTHYNRYILLRSHIAFVGYFNLHHRELRHGLCLRVGTYCTMWTSYHHSTRESMTYSSSTVWSVLVLFLAAYASSKTVHICISSTFLVFKTIYNILELIISTAADACAKTHSFNCAYLMNTMMHGRKVGSIWARKLNMCYGLWLRLRIVFFGNFSKSQSRPTLKMTNKIP